MNVNLETPNGTKVWVLHSDDLLSADYSTIKISQVTIVCHKHFAYKSFYTDDFYKPGRHNFLYKNAYLTREAAKDACIKENHRKIKQMLEYIETLFEVSTTCTNI